MKKVLGLLFVLFAMSLASCNQAPLPPSPFAGIWGGDFSVVLPNGTAVSAAGELDLTVSTNGAISGTIFSNDPRAGLGKIINGVVNAQGDFTVTYAYNNNPTGVLRLTGKIKIEGGDLVGTGLRNTTTDASNTLVATVSVELGRL